MTSSKQPKKYAMAAALLAVALASFFVADERPGKGPFQVPCDVVRNFIDATQLARFVRVPGAYHIDQRGPIWMNMAEFGWPNVVIPRYTYAHPLNRDEPLKGLRLSDVENNVNVSVVHLPEEHLRKLLYRALLPQVFERYKNRHVFSFFEEGLGIYTSGFGCGEMQSKRSIVMLMIGGIPTIFGSQTRVYFLTEPKALLLVPSSDVDRKDSVLRLLFPDQHNVDALYVVTMFASRSQIGRIIGSLEKDN